MAIKFSINFFQDIYPNMDLPLLVVALFVVLCYFKKSNVGDDNFTKIVVTEHAFGMTSHHAFQRVATNS